AVQGIEGHHIHPVNFHPDDIGLAADPNNITFATHAGHIDHLHEGNTTNYTSDNYIGHNEIYTHEEMLKITLEERHEAYMTESPLYNDVGALSYAGVSTFATVALFTTVKAGIELFRLRGSNFSN